MFGQYKTHHRTSYEGVLTGKGLTYGGSLARTEATGYGLVYFVDEYLKCNGDSFDGKTVVHLRLRQRGHLRHARRPSSSAPRWSPCPTPPAGCTIRRASISTLLKQIKEVERGRITEYAARREGVEYHEGRGVWVIPCDIALPCATQNELHVEDVEHAREERLQDAVAEGANMPTTLEATEYPAGARHRVLARARRPTPAAWPPPRLEMSQNSERLSWTFEEVDAKLQGHHGEHLPRHATTPPSATATRATTSWAPTSPASRRSPTP